jgi:signal transduction histidine kinase/DNA-binding response OmpR family regulator
LGIPVKEMVGMHHTQTYPPKEAKRAEEILKKYTQIGKGITSEEIFVQHRDGCKIPVEISFSVFEIGGKKTILGIFRDITERKKSQNELKKSEIRYRQLFEDSPIAIWEEDFSELKIYFDKLKEEGVQDFYKYFEKNPDALKACLQKARVLDVNKAALKLYKAENKEELLGNLNKTFTEKSLQVFKEEIIAIAEGANRFEAEAVVKTLTGENRYIYLRLYLGQMKENNLNYSRALVVTNDITEQKKMENALLLSEKMKSMGIVTSGVAHEFNNILAIVKGFALQIKKKCGDDNKLEKRVDTIIKASNDGVEIVRRMREYTNIEMDNTDFAPADVRSLIKQAIEFTTPRWLNIAHANSINYKINADDCSEVLCVMGNQSELREVLINIINNALDAMPDGGSLSYRTWGKENMVFVSISDTGTGMGKNIQEKLFDPFFTTKAGVGTGLGMSVAYGIITRHGGKIDVESEEGVGSTFTIRLPMSKETVITEDADESEQEIKAEGLRILIVDDEQKICDLLSEHFLEDGHTVKSVNSGSMAIKLLRTENFDLVLSDLVMPEVSGHDIIKAVGMLEKKPKVGIITVDSTGKGEALKADFIVKKPIDFSELTLCINNVLSKYSSYDIGIAEIDIQHADMDLLLSKLSEEGLSQDIEKENFEFFRNTISSHFDFEEKWAQTNNKIFDADHLKAHNELLELLNEMNTQYRNKQLNMNTICLTIKKKLLSHVRNHDIRMITIS